MTGSHGLLPTSGPLYGATCSLQHGRPYTNPWTTAGSFLLTIYIRTPSAFSFRFLFVWRICPSSGRGAGAAFISAGLRPLSTAAVASGAGMTTENCGGRTIACNNPRIQPQPHSSTRQTNRRDCHRVNSRKSPPRLFHVCPLCRKTSLSVRQNVVAPCPWHLPCLAMAVVALFSPRSHQHQPIETIFPIAGRGSSVSAGGGRVPRPRRHGPRPAPARRRGGQAPPGRTQPSALCRRGRSGRETPSRYALVYGKGLLVRSLECVHHPRSVVYRDGVISTSSPTTRADLARGSPVCRCSGQLARLLLLRMYRPRLLS